MNPATVDPWPWATAPHTEHPHRRRRRLHGDYQPADGIPLNVGDVETVEAQE